MNTLKHFYQLARPFWGGKGSLKAWLLLAAVSGFALAIVRVSVYITAWNKDFYDALEQFNRPLLYTLLWQYLGYIAFTVGFVVARAAHRAIHANVAGAPSRLSPANPATGRA